MQDKRNRNGEVICVVCGNKATRRLDYTNEKHIKGLAFCDAHNYNDLKNNDEEN